MYLKQQFSHNFIIILSTSFIKLFQLYHNVTRYMFLYFLYVFLCLQILALYELNFYKILLFTSCN